MVGLVDLVDQQDHLLLAGEGLAQLAQLHVLLDIVHALAAELAVIQALHHVVDVEAVLGLGGGLDVPDGQGLAHGGGEGLGQHGLAGTGLTLDEQGLLERDGDIGGLEQLFAGDVVLTAAEFFLHSDTSFVEKNGIPEKKRTGGRNLPPVPSAALYSSFTLKAMWNYFFLAALGSAAAGWGSCTVSMWTS